MSHTWAGVILWTMCWYPESLGLCFSHVVQASLCTAVYDHCRYCGSSGKAAQRVVVVLEGDAHCALSESCTPQRIVVPPPQRNQNLCQQRVFMAAQSNVVVLFLRMPIALLGRFMYHRSIGFHIFVLNVHHVEHSKLCNCTI